MKKLIITLAVAASALIGSAAPLFPFFVDLAGNYKDGTPDELAALGFSSMYWGQSPFYSTAESAREFLGDVLPSEGITEENAVGDTIKVTKYTSTFSDDEKTSDIQLVTLPDGTFYILYNEYSLK